MDENADEAEGRSKEAAGDPTDDDSLRWKGRLVRAETKAQEKVDEIKERADELIESVDERNADRS